MQLKIAMLHWAFPPTIGGVESHLAMLGPDLVNRGLEVHLLTGTIEGRPTREIYQGMRICRTPWMDLNSMTPEKMVDAEKDIRRELFDFIREVQPDLIHAHNVHYFSPVHARSLGEVRALRGVPLILTAHNAWKGTLWDEINSLSSQWDGVIAVSGYIKNQLVQSGYEPGRVWVVHHGIDLDMFEHTERGEQNNQIKMFPGRRVVFHPARMCYDKGTHVAIEALALLRDEFPEVLLVMAGTEQMVDWRGLREGYISKIADLIVAAKLDDHVFIKFTPWQEMPYMYRQAEFCIYPSCFEEPFGLVMLESMACGRPLVVSRAGGMPEVIEDGKNGFLVEMHDHHQLAQRCGLLLREPELTRRMGIVGRQLVQKSFTRHKMAERTLEVYRTVMRE